MAKKSNLPKKSSRKQTKNYSLLFIISFIVLTALIYSHTLHSPFYYDDYHTIIDNKEIKSNAIAYQINTPRYIGLLTFAFNYRISKLDPFSYHLVNIVIHIANGILLYFLVIQLLTLLPGDLFAEKKYLLSFIIALLFLVHPVQTQSVTYICQRFTSLAAFFVLCSILFYFKFRATDPLRYKFLILSLVFGLLAFKTKENTAMLPVMIVVSDLIFFKVSKITIKKGIIFFLPYFLILSVIVVSFISFNRPFGEILTETIEKSAETKAISRWEYLFTEFRVMVTYMRLLVLPVKQSLLYYYPISHSLFEVPVLFSFFVIGACLIAGIVMLKYYPLISYGIFWFFIFLLIESSIIPISDVIYEHRLYLPSIGFVIAITFSLFMVFQKLHWKGFKFICFGVAIVFAVFTYIRNDVWKDPVALWKDAVTKFPQSSRARINLGIAYGSKDMCQEAIPELETGLRKDPNNARGHSSLANCYLRQGLFDAAMKEINTAIAFTPNDAGFYTNLAIIYMQKEDIHNAVAVLQKAHQIDDKDPAINALLGKCYCLTGNLTKALPLFDESLAVDERNPHIYYEKALCQLRFNRTKESRADLLKSIELKPDLLDPYFYIGITYEQEHDLAHAVTSYQQVLSLSTKETPLTREARKRLDALRRTGS